MSHDQTQKKAPKAGKSQARNVPPFAHEFRLKVARLYVDDHPPAKLIASQFGISDDSVYRWSKNYRRYGEQGRWINLKQRPDPSCRQR